MPRNRITTGCCLSLAVFLAALFSATPARAYVDLAPTMSKILTDSRQIVLVEVVEFDPKTLLVTLKPVRAIKGELPAGTMRHVLVRSDGASAPRQVVRWAVPGARGVLFLSGNNALACVGQGWYQIVKSGAIWRLSADRPDLPLAYYGTVSRLLDGIDQILAGKEAVLTMAPHGAEAAASFELALNRANLPGLLKVQRIRASLNMPGTVMAMSADPAYVIGQGPADEADIPALITKLASPDPMIRAEACDDLRSLGHKAKSAAAAVAKLQNDPAQGVRFAADAALLRILPADDRALTDLAKGLQSPETLTRRLAAKYAGLSGPAGGQLAEKLAALLSDADESTRLTALEAVATIGPPAAKAAPAIVPMLDNPSTAIDAADTLGRIGPAARPMPKQLATMLKSDKPDVRWAAVRAMSQIGGPDSHPAVEFMIHALPSANEVDGYNMMVYLSLIGPDAKDAVATIKSIRIKNPILPSSTLWAIESETELPWQRQSGFGRGPGGGGPGGFGGPGGGGGGPGGPGGFDIGGVIYEAYVDELGERLRPLASVLAHKIMDNTAGNIPQWGYRILNCGSDDAVAILTPYLSDKDATLRERAAVALGYMGSTAGKAQGDLSKAAGAAKTEQEKLLMEWSVSQVNGESN